MRLNPLKSVLAVVARQFCSVVLRVCRFLLSLSFSWVTLREEERRQRLS